MFLSIYFNGLECNSFGLMRNTQVLAMVSGYLIDLACDASCPVLRCVGFFDASGTLVWFRGFSGHYGASGGLYWWVFSLGTIDALC